MAGRRRSILALCLFVAWLLPTYPATASETVIYSYDARGRLVKVARSGSVNNGVSACYTYDKADNRSNVTVVTSGSCAAGVTLTLSPTSLPNGTVGTAYSQTITAGGGSGGYAYSKTSGTLPAGLALSGSTGVLSGTPTAASTYNFTITATDSSSNTGSRAYSITTSSAPSNQPPIANPDAGGSMGKCTVKYVNVTANDSDPDGDPLTVLSATASGDMSASVDSASTVLIESGQTTGTKSIAYTISDGRGGTASSTISVTVSGGVCN